MPRLLAGKTVRRGGEQGARGVHVWRGYSTLRNPEARSKQLEKKKIQNPILPREAEPAGAAEKRARLLLGGQTPPPALPQDQQRALQPSPHLQEHARLRCNRRHAGAQPGALETRPPGPESGCTCGSSRNRGRGGGGPQGAGARVPARPQRHLPGGERAAARIPSGSVSAFKAGLRVRAQRKVGKGKPDCSPPPLLKGAT